MVWVFAAVSFWACALVSLLFGVSYPRQALGRKRALRQALSKHRVKLRDLPLEFERTTKGRAAIPIQGVRV